VAFFFVALVDIQIVHLVVYLVLHGLAALHTCYRHVNLTALSVDWLISFA
jgi:hypothetical protein